MEELANDEMRACLMALDPDANASVASDNEEEEASEDEEQEKDGESNNALELLKSLAKAAANQQSPRCSTQHLQLAPHPSQPDRWHLSGTGQLDGQHRGPAAATLASSFAAA